MARLRKIVLSALLGCWITIPAPAQPLEGQKWLRGVSVGMGVGAHAAATVTDYVNAVALPPIKDRLDEFNAIAEFYVAPEFQVTTDWSLALEYGYQIKSFSVVGSSGIGRSDFSYEVHMPTGIAHYLIAGDGYWLKLGGGVGYYFGRFSQTLYGLNQREAFRAEGPGLKIEAVGNTKFDETFYGSVGVDVRWIFGREFKAPEGRTATVSGQTAKFNSFTLGLKFGVMFLY